MDWAWMPYPHQHENIMGLRYASTGAPLSTVFEVSTNTNETQFSPVMAPSGTDNFVVAWTSHPAGWNIQAQLFTSPDIFADGFESGDLSARSLSQP